VTQSRSRPRIVAVVARRPQLGAVKTRLATAIGEAAALDVFRELLGGTLRSAEQLAEVELVLALADEAADGVTVAPPPAADILVDLGRAGDTQAARWRSLAQRGAGLGERLANVFADLFAQGAAAVAIVNSDSPALPAEFLRQAFALLAEPEPHGKPAARGQSRPRGGLVLGPSTDGGFYLIGTDAATWRARSAAIGEVLTSAPLGSARALAFTSRAAKASGLTVSSLPLWTDIDDAADLPLMQRLLSPGTAADRPRGEPLEGLREIYLHVTNRCGLACAHCYNRANPLGSGELTTAEWTRAVDQCVALGATSFVVIGGDPLLRPDLLAIVDHITGVHERKVRIFFNRLITAATATEMARLGRGLFRPMVSVDGPAEVNDALRAPGNFADGVTSIRNLVAAGLTPVVNTVLLAPVLPGLSRMARTLGAAGVTRLHLILPHHRGGLPENLELVPDGAEMAAAVLRLRRTAAEIGLQLDNFTAFKRRLGGAQDFCTCGCRDLAVDPYGKVHACTITCGDPAFVAGDLKREDLETIWRGSPAFRLLRNVHARDRAECAACAIVDACGGECWMQAHYAANVREEPAGYAAPFPYCDYVRPVFADLLAEAGAAGGASANAVGAAAETARSGGGSSGACDSGDRCAAPVGVGGADYTLFDCI
jgi:radical SAM protein with 4Fe4S-binding SPASM domain